MTLVARALIALPLLVAAVTLCGLALGALGVIAEPLLNRIPSGGIARWICVGLVVSLLGAAGDYGFSRLSRRSFGLSDHWSLAVRDATLIIGGGALVIGATFLVMSLFPAYASQTWPLRATGAILVAGALLLFLLRLRSRATRRGPTEPSSQSNADSLDRRRSSALEATPR